MEHAGAPLLSIYLSIYLSCQSVSLLFFTSTTHSVKLGWNVFSCIRQRYMGMYIIYLVLFTPVTQKCLFCRAASLDLFSPQHYVCISTWEILFFFFFFHSTLLDVQVLTAIAESLISCHGCTIFFFFFTASTGLRDVKWFPVLPLEWPVGLVVCVSICVCIMVCICVYEVSMAARAGVILLPRYCSLTISLMTQRLRETRRNLNPLVRMYGSVCHRTSGRICALMVQVINSRNTMWAIERKHKEREYL